MEIKKAKKLIEEYCYKEFGEDTKVDFSDLTKVPIAYTTTEDEKHTIQVNVNLIDFRVETLVDDNCISTDQYGSLEEMNEEVLPYLDFDRLVCISDEDLQTSVEEVIRDAVKRSEKRIGDMSPLEKG